jgi:hypothetical protein
MRYGELLEYLRYQYLPFNNSSNSNTKTTIVSGNRGGILQRARLTFRVVPCHPGDKIRSWERPLQEFFHADGEIPKATPITHEILDRLKILWEEKRQHHQQQQQMPQINESPSQRSNDHATEKKANADASASSDDEDIFGGVGDYDGAAAATAIIKDDDEDHGNSETRSTKHTKNSFTKEPIFGSEGEGFAHLHITTISSQEEATWPLRGLTSLVGDPDNYDDGIGMDFDARDYDDDEENEGGKSKRSKRTKKKRTDSE